MKDSGKKKSQLLREIKTLRKQVQALENAQEAQKRAERALWQYWNLLDTLLASTEDLFSLKNIQGRYQAASPSFCRFLGKAEKDIRGQRDGDLFPGDLARIFHRYDASVFEKNRPYTWEEPVKRIGGQYWFRFQKTPLLGHEGECIGLLCIARNVTTERRAIEQNRIFMRTGQDGFWMLDAHGNILDVNEEYCKLTGYSRMELLGKNLHDIEVLATPEEISLRNRRIMEVGWERFKTLHRGKDNRIIELEVCCNYVDIAGGRFYRFFHEINAIPNLSSEEPTPLMDTVPVTTAQEEDTPANSKEKEPNKKVINLNDVVRQSWTLQLETMPAGIRLEQDLDPALKNVLAHQPQILQILMNLITNAREAIEGRGYIKVITRNIDIDSELARIFPPLHPGAHVYLAVEDNGRGISKKLIDKIFAPFITTKYRGRGMGLASAYRNVTDHQGHITVKSREGYGSTFCVYFPATNKTPEIPISRMQIPTGTETVLLVDSESYVLGDTRQMLERLAYKTLVAQTPEEALELVRSFPGKIHLTVIDTEIQHENTEAILQALHKTRPDMKIILTGARQLDRYTQDMLDAGASSFVQKPLRVDVLAPKIRSVLDE